MSAGLDVIVNVDDLGLHPAVRRAVERCAEIGAVTSASVLANGPDVGSVREVPGVTLGAHLNVLRGRPLSPPGEVRSLVDARGLFVGSAARLALRVARGAVNPDEVVLEWSRQVESLRARGLALSHLDGEKHTHCLPPLFRAACEVAARHGIPFVRRSAEQYGRMAFGMPAIRRNVLRALCARAPLSHGARSTGSVWGIAEQGARLRPESFVRALRGARCGSVEIVCHPGDRRKGDPELPGSFGTMRVAELWEPEFRSLSEARWREAIAAEGWRLTGFEGLAR